MTRVRVAMSVLALCGVAAILGLAAAYAAGQKGQGPPVPDEVRRVADGGMKAFLHAEGDKGLDRLGFRAAREVSNASVGEGLRVYELQPRLLLDRADAVSFEGLLEETGMWQLLVMDGTVPKAVLTVDRHQGAIQAVSIGGAGLAEQLNALLVRWPASTYDLRFVISHQAGAQFMDIGEGGRPVGVVPLLSARVALGLDGGFDPNDVRSAEFALARLRPLVRSAMANTAGVR